MTRPDWEHLKTYTMNRLAKELPPNLEYHGLHHTHDVLDAAERLGSLANLDADDAFLLKTAALYHDFGFIVQSAEHEQVSAELASRILPDFDFTEEQITRVQGMIMATRLPQTPHNFLEELICDADLDSIGREDFIITSHNLLRELRARGAVIHMKQWYETQLRFLSGQTFWTRVAKDLRDDGKRRNIEDLQRRIQALGDSIVWEIPD